jgi:hypothetical protein
LNTQRQYVIQRANLSAFGRLRQLDVIEVERCIAGEMRGSDFYPTVAKIQIEGGSAS